MIVSKSCFSDPYMCRRSILFLVCACCLLLAQGCAGVRPDLRRLYSFESDAMVSAQQAPVILIHGAFGSRLSSIATGKEAWPGSMGKIMLSEYREIALPIDPDTLEPLKSEYAVSGIADHIIGRDYYGDIINVLEDVADFQRTSVGTPVQSDRRRYYVFEYDWRYDNVESARALDTFIEQIRKDHSDPDLKVDIIAHSMGGLIARYFVRYGTEDVLNDNDFPVNQHGASHVRRVVLLGTPNLGSVLAVRNVIRGFKIGFRRMPTEVLVTFPSGYQLFPHPLSQWVLNADGNPSSEDFFSASTWEKFELSVFSPEVQDRIRSEFSDSAAANRHIDTLQAYFRKHVERGRRFLWSLTVPVPENRVEYRVFGGDCALTPAKILIEGLGEDRFIRLGPREIKSPTPGVDYDRMMLEPGDGTVTKASLLARQTLDPSVPRHRYSDFPLKYPFFLCEDHSKLTGNINFQDNLLHALLSADED